MGVHWLLTPLDSCTGSLKSSLEDISAPPSWLVAHQVIYFALAFSWNLVYKPTYIFTKKKGKKKKGKEIKPEIRFWSRVRDYRHWWIESIPVDPPTCPESHRKIGFLLVLWSINYWFLCCIVIFRRNWRERMRSWRGGWILKRTTIPIRVLTEATILKYPGQLSVLIIWSQICT